jgi:hypothetical protein
VVVVQANFAQVMLIYLMLQHAASWAKLQERDFLKEDKE